MQGDGGQLHDLNKQPSTQAHVVEAAPLLSAAKLALPIMQGAPLNKILRLGLYFWPALCCLMLTLWAASYLRQNTIENTRYALESAADASRTLFELRMSELEQIMQSNAGFLALAEPSQTAWQMQIEQQDLSKKLAGEYALELVNVSGKEAPERESNGLIRILRAGSQTLSRGVEQPEHLQKLRLALAQAQATNSMQMIEVHDAAGNQGEPALGERLAQFVYPVMLLSKTAERRVQEQPFLMLTVKLQPLVGMLVGRENQRFEMAVFDIASVDLNHQIFHVNPAKVETLYAPLAQLRSTRKVLVGAQWWSLQLAPTAEIASAEHFYPEELVLLGGGGLALILLGLMFLVSHSNTSTQVATERCTQDFFASEARFQRAVNGTHDGVWDIDVRAGKIYFSPRFYELLGYAEAEVEQPFAWWLTRLPEQDKKRWEEQYAAWSNHPQSFELKVQLYCKKGTLRWYRLRGLSIKGSEGVDYISGSLSDIQDELDLARREQQLIELTETSPDVVMVFDLEGTVMYMNRAGLKVFGTDQVNGLAIAQIFSQNDTEMLLNEAVPQAFMRSIWGGETELVTVDGRVIPVSQVVIGHRGHDGQVEYYSAVLHDITEIRKSQEAMREITERFERALNATNDGVFERKVGEDKLSMSPRMKQVLGYGPDMPESRYFIYENTHPEDRRKLVQLTRQLESIGGKWSIDVRVKNQEGVYHWVRSRGEVLLDKDDKPYLYTGIWSDVTIEKELALELEKHREHLVQMVEERTAKLALARDEAERANQSKSEFLANMSHELRTPMHAIISFAKFGVDKWDKAELPKLKHWFDNIYKSGSRLLDLLNNLLDLSKLEAGKMELELRWKDTRAIAEDLRIETEALARSRELSIVFDVAKRDGQAIETFAWIDEVRLMQVLRNLLSNAIKFSPMHSTITLAWSLDQINFGRRATDVQLIDALVIEVRDQGIGIPEDELESVFDKFVQSSKTKSGAGGTGLGLSICREIVHAHRGTICARNNTQSEAHESPAGATFEVRLPLIAPTQNTLSSEDPMETMGMI